MRPLVQMKQKAIDLRRRGFSYRDILAEIPVSKSSLSFWLKELPLTDDEQHYLKKRRDSNISQGRIRAASSNHMRRVVRDGFLQKDAQKEFDSCKEDPFFQLGIGLYWAEGSKRSPAFGFMNSDPDMIKVMLKWIFLFLKPEIKEVGLRLYANENHEAFWLKETRLPGSNLKKTIYKPSNLLGKKRPNYKGCVRLELGKAIHIKKMRLWQQMLIEHYAKQG